MNGWLTPKEVAERLKISRSAAYALIRKLPRLKMGQIVRVSEEALDEYLQSKMQPPRQDTTLEARLRSANALLRSYEAADRASKPKHLPSGTASRRVPLTRRREVLEEPARPPIRRTRQPPKLTVSAPLGRPNLDTILGKAEGSRAHGKAPSSSRTRYEPQNHRMALGRPVCAVQK
jgi:excisionase family DNA binding protein